jgi:ABC-2 type transport system ATP-binding protein
MLNLLLLDEHAASLDPATARHAPQENESSPPETLAFSVLAQYVQSSSGLRPVLFLSHGKILLEGDPGTLPADPGQHLRATSPHPARR